MSILNPDIIRDELDKPIEMERGLKEAFGVTPDGSEAETYYGLHDRKLIADEMQRLYKNLTARREKSPASGKTFYITTGGPGSGKTKLVESLQKKGGALSGAIHLDPDEVILKKFSPYIELVKGAGDNDAVRAAAYTYWRWASVYINNTLINKLADNGYDIVYGTTGTSASVTGVYAAAKAQGYKTHLMIVHAPEEVRLDGVAQRFAVERRYTPISDVRKKGNQMFSEVLPLHFAHAESIELFWRGEKNKGPVLAASTVDGRWVIHDQTAYNDFFAEIKKHNPALDQDAMIKAFEKRIAVPAITQPRLQAAFKP